MAPFATAVAYRVRQYDLIPNPRGSSVKDWTAAPFVIHTPSWAANTTFEFHFAIDRASTHPVCANACSCRLSFSSFNPGGMLPVIRSMLFCEKHSSTPWIDAKPVRLWFVSTYEFAKSHTPDGSGTGPNDTRFFAAPPPTTSRDK